MIPVLRRYEWFLFVFFVYIASLALVLRRPVGVVSALLALGLVVGIARVDAAAGRPWSRILRDWMSPGYILVAYWTLAPLARPDARQYDAVWVHWDRLLLHDYGLRSLVELAGGFLPASLELVYLLLYGLPTALIGWFYWSRRRDRMETFLEVLFASALLTYALIPLVPSAPPRLEFAGYDLPGYLSIFRRLNLWLQMADITTGVFPSGHVTVAIACVFGLRRAVPEDASLARWLSAYTAVLMLSTVYGRYHYAVDVVAAASVSLFAIGVIDRLADARPIPEVAMARRRSRG